jgi:glucokinase-like ROK family protein
MSKVLRKNQIRRNLVLRALFDDGVLSLTELKDKTGITLPVLTQIVSTLTNEKFVVKVKEKEINQAGRPPQNFKLNNKAGYIIGIDIGRVFSNYVVLDLEQNIIKEQRKPSFDLDNSNKFVNDLYKEVRALVASANVSWNKIFGIGISIPGIVKGREGFSYTYLNFESSSVRDVFEKKFNKPVHIEHDVKAMAIGELWMGKAKGYQNVLCINVGWGVALGIIIDGKIYYGKDGFSGEFGHLQVVPEGELCYCGKRGCLETVSSAKAITRIAKEKIQNGEKTIILKNQNFDLEKLDAATIIEAANKGDQFSIEILENAGKYLGLGIGYLINIFNPERIILGGGITRANPYIMDSMTSTAMKQSLVHISKKVEFHISELGFKAGAIGVAMLAVKDLFEVEHLNPTAYV